MLEVVLLVPSVIRKKSIQSKTPLFLKNRVCVVEDVLALPSYRGSVSDPGLSRQYVSGVPESIMYSEHPVCEASFESCRPYTEIEDPARKL